MVGRDGAPCLVQWIREWTMKSHSEAVAYGERSTTRICKCTGHEAPFHRAPAAVDVRAWRFPRAARRATNYRHLTARSSLIHGYKYPSSLIPPLFPISLPLPTFNTPRDFLKPCHHSAHTRRSGRRTHARTTARSAAETATPGRRVSANRPPPRRPGSPSPPLRPPPPLAGVGSTAPTARWQDTSGRRARVPGSQHLQLATAMTMVTTTTTMKTVT